MIKTSLIIIGGRGSRMGNLTHNKPKCLLKVGNFTILCHLFTQLRYLKVKKIILCTGYLDHVIKKYCKKKLVPDSNNLIKKLKKNIQFLDLPKIVFSKSSADNSTSNRLIKAKKDIKEERFLFLYGDTLLKPNINQMINLMDKKKLNGVITISNPPSNFGQIKTSKDLITDFEEKQIIKDVWVNSGWMIIKTKILKQLKKTTVNFENYLFKNEIKKKKLGFYKNKGLYFPLDRVHDLKKASIIFKTRKITWY